MDRWTRLKNVTFKTFVFLTFAILLQKAINLFFSSTNPIWLFISYLWIVLLLPILIFHVQKGLFRSIFSDERSIPIGDKKRMWVLISEEVVGPIKLIILNLAVFLFLLKLIAVISLYTTLEAGFLLDRVKDAMIGLGYITLITLILFPADEYELALPGED